MSSFILTLKSNLDVLEASFNNEDSLSLNVIKNNSNFVIAILAQNKIESDNFFCEYGEYSVALVGMINYQIRETP